MLEDAVEPIPEDAAAARVRDFAGDRDAPLQACPPTTMELAAMNRLIGFRVKRALELSGLRWSDFLSRNEGSNIERGFIAAPVWLLVRIAAKTGVSLDYLVGLTDESEVGEVPAFRELILPHLLRADEQRAIQALELQRQRSRLGAMEKLAAESWEALCRIEELNGEAWDNMRGGARLRASLSKFSAAVEGFQHD